MTTVGMNCARVYDICSISYYTSSYSFSSLVKLSEMFITLSCGIYFFRLSDTNASIIVFHALQWKWPKFRIENIGTEIVANNKYLKYCPNTFSFFLFFCRAFWAPRGSAPTAERSSMGSTGSESSSPSGGISFMGIKPLRFRFALFLFLLLLLTPSIFFCATHHLAVTLLVGTLYRFP